MNRLFFVLIAAFGCLIYACQFSTTTEPSQAMASTETNDAAQKNLKAVHAINSAFESGDFSSIRSLFADEAIDHAGETGDIVGADSFVAMMQVWAKMAKEMKGTVVKELADKEYVFQWMKASGTMVENGFGMKKGEAFNSDAVEVSKFNNEGKITEHWTFVSYGEMMKMMESFTKK